MDLDFLEQNVIPSYLCGDHTILFNVQKKNYFPFHGGLEFFCKRTYEDLVFLYQNLEKTQEYVYTQEAFIAQTTASKKLLAWTIGGGTTLSEASATHTLGWELHRLSEQYLTHPKAFDLRLIVIGYPSKVTSFQ